MARRPFLSPCHYWQGPATYPEASDGPSSSASLFGLAPCGVLPATSVARSAVRSYRTISPLPFAKLRAVSFLCHYSVRLPCPGVTRRTALWSSDFPLPIALRHQRSPAGAASIGSGRLAWLRLLSFSPRLAVCFFRDPVLLQLLVKIAAWRIDQIRRFRNIPLRFTQLLHEERTLRRFLVLAKRGCLDRFIIRWARTAVNARRCCRRAS
jgi:hypothetical protein